MPYATIPTLYSRRTRAMGEDSLSLQAPSSMGSHREYLPRLWSGAEIDDLREEDRAITLG